MIIHTPSKKENKNDAGLNISNQSASSPQVCFRFLFDPVHPSAFCLSRKYTLHIKNFSFSPPPPPPLPISILQEILEWHYWPSYTIPQKIWLWVPVYTLWKRRTAVHFYIIIAIIIIFSSNIILIPSLPNKKVGHFQLGTLSC